MPETPEKPVESLNFEQAFAELEALVRRLEGGETGLEESLRLFERGVALARVCSMKLEAAEARIEQLISGEDGDRIEPFQPTGKGTAV